MRPQTQGKIERWHHSWDTRPDTTRPTFRAGECGQILETLEGQTASARKLQILSLIRKMWYHLFREDCRIFGK